MKRYITLILAALCSLTVMADNDNNTSQPSKPITIITGTLVDPIERSIQYVSATLNLSMDLIEIEFAGLGEGEIYIVDSCNKVVNYVTVSLGMSYVAIDFPQEDGNYYLVVSCSHYYGEGYFTIK